MLVMFYVFFFKQKTAYELRISDWSSDVCSSDLRVELVGEHRLQLVAAVAVAVAQQGQAVAALDRGVALGLDVASDHVLGLELAGVAAAALGHQDVAVG